MRKKVVHRQRHQVKRVRGLKVKKGKQKKKEKGKQSQPRALVTVPGNSLHRCLLAQPLGWTQRNKAHLLLKLQASHRAQDKRCPPQKVQCRIQGNAVLSRNLNMCLNTIFGLCIVPAILVALVFFFISWNSSGWSQAAILAVSVWSVLLQPYLACRVVRLLREVPRRTCRN